MTKKGKYIYDWPRPMVTVDAVVFSFFEGKHESRVKVLLIRRKDEPFKGKWAVPGGFVGIDEELEGAAARELAEETGLSNIRLFQMHTFGKCGRDPRGRQITVAFTGIAGREARRVKAGDDAAEAEWFDIENPPEEMAFDHDEMIEYAIRELKRKKIYQDAMKRR